MNIEKENTKNTDRKSLYDREVLTKDKNEVKEKIVPTEIEDPCVCKEKCNSYKVHFEKDNVIFILKRAKCSVDQGLRFRGLCCSCRQLQNWALCKPSFEPNSINSPKK